MTQGSPNGKRLKWQDLLDGLDAIAEKVEDLRSAVWVEQRRRRK